jgi:hypothetical protein
MVKLFRPAYKRLKSYIILFYFEASSIYITNPLIAFYNTIYPHAPCGVGNVVVKIAQANPP